jgi:tRNA A37 N6-isopentenylltransferase MiaA
MSLDQQRFLKMKNKTTKTTKTTKMQSTFASFHHCFALHTDPGRPAESRYDAAIIVLSQSRLTLVNKLEQRIKDHGRFGKVNR